MLKNTSGSKVTWKRKQIRSGWEGLGGGGLRPKRYLAQHVVLLHVVDLPGVDLPLQRVLEELAADVEQHGADGPFLQRAARRRLVVVAGGRDAVPQDDAHQQT